MNAAAATTVYLELPTPIQTQLHRTSLRLLQAAMRAQLPGNLKLLLHTLCMHHNDQAGCAWPSVERLAKLCSTSTRTVQRNLSELVQRGMVIVGRAPGIRSNAYAVQEERLNTIAIATLQNAPAQPAALHWLRPTTTFAAPEATPTAPTPDTHVTQTEVNGVELKKTGEEESQAENPAEAAQAEQAALAQVNTQRQRNGKRPLSRADTQTMAHEAQRAHLTPLQALQWVLARASRNFFKADYAGGAATAATAAPPPYRPTPPAQPVQPVQPDLDTQALFARQARAQEAKAAQPAAIVPDTSPLTIAGQQITGPAWAMSAVRQFCAGVPVNLFRIQAACSVLGVSHKALRGLGCTQPNMSP